MLQYVPRRRKVLENSSSEARGAASRQSVAIQRAMGGSPLRAYQDLVIGSRMKLSVLHAMRSGSSASAIDSSLTSPPVP